MSIDKQTIFEKTPKGINESKGRWGIFADKRQKILALIDAKSTVEAIIAASGMKENKLLPELEALLDDRLIRETWAPAAEFTINGAHHTPQGIQVADANTMAYMEAIKKQKPPENEEELISLDDITEKLQKESEQQAKREEADRQLQIEEKVRQDAERLAREAAERKAQEGAERAAREEAERIAQEEDVRRVREQAERKAQEEAERVAHQKAARKAQEEAERKVREERIAKRLKAREAEDRRMREENERKAQEEAERQAREEAERLAKAEEERRAREEAERKAQEEAERAAREEAERLAKAEEEHRAREEAERKAQEEAERAAHEEAERQAKAEEERRAREEAERKVQEEAERAAREEAERQAKAEEEHRAREEAERKVQEEAERVAREEAERLAKVEEERRVREEAERKAQEEAERAAREEAERLAKAEEEHRAREEAERKVQEEAEHVAREEAERLAKAEEEHRAREEAERKAQEEAERAAREEAEQQARAEEERRTHEEAERKAQEEAERVAREEAECLAKSEEESRAHEEAERKAQENDERAAREEAERIAREVEARRASEAAERKVQEEAERADRKEAERQALAEEARLLREEEERKAQEKAERKTREAAEKYARKEARLIAREVGESGNRMAGFLPRLKWVAAGCVALLVLALVGIQFVPLTSSRDQLEKLASMTLGEPVKIQALHIALFPSPHLKLEQIQIGAQGGSRIKDAIIHAGWGTLLGSERMVERIELDQVELAPGMLESVAGWPARNAQQQPAYQIARVALRHMQIASEEAAFPSLKGEFDFASSGNFDKGWLGSEDGVLRADFSPSPEGLGVSVSTSEFTPFYFLPVKVSSLRASARVGDRKIRFAELDGSVSGGKVNGSLTLSWDSGWSVVGDVHIAGANIAVSSAKAESPAVSGKLDASLGFSRRARLPEQLFSQPLLSGSVTLRNGAITGFDLPATLHYAVEGIYTGQTPYDVWSFRLEPAGDKQAYKAIRIVGKGLLLEGNGEISAKGALSGNVKLAVETRQKTVRGNYKLDGSLTLPTIHPLK